MTESSLIEEVAGGGELPLDEKLPDICECEFEDPISGDTCDLTGAIELHRLALEDPVQLERRAEEITVEIINSTCSMTHYVGWYKEVRQVPLLNTYVPR